MWQSGESTAWTASLESEPLGMAGSQGDSLPSGSSGGVDYSVV